MYHVYYGYLIGYELIHHDLNYNQMGNQQSEGFAPHFVAEDWLQIEQSTSAKIWQNRLNKSLKVEEYQIITQSQEDLLYEKKIFNIRKHNPQLVASYFLHEKPQQLCSFHSNNSIFLERIPIRLSDLEHIPYPDYLHLYKNCLCGYALLTRSVGSHFIVSQDMIGINQEGVVKVWLNERFQVSFGRGKISQEMMVWNVIELISKAIDPMLLPPSVPSVRNYLYNQSDLISFNQAIARLKQFSDRFNKGEIPLKMKCIDRVGGVYEIANRNKGEQLANGQNYNGMEREYVSNFDNKETMVYGGYTPISKDKMMYNLVRSVVHHQQPRENQLSYSQIHNPQNSRPQIIKRGEPYLSNDQPYPFKDNHVLLRDQPIMREQPVMREDKVKNNIAIMAEQQTKISNIYPQRAVHINHYIPSAPHQKIPPRPSFISFNKQHPPHPPTVSAIIQPLTQQYASAKQNIYSATSSNINDNNYHPTIRRNFNMQLNNNGYDVQKGDQMPRLRSFVSPLHHQLPVHNHPNLMFNPNVVEYRPQQPRLKETQLPITPTTFNQIFPQPPKPNTPIPKTNNHHHSYSQPKWTKQIATPINFMKRQANDSPYPIKDRKILVKEQDHKILKYQSQTTPRSPRFTVEIIPGKILKEENKQQKKEKKRPWLKSKKSDEMSQDVGEDYHKKDPILQQQQLLQQRQAIQLEDETNNNELRQQQRAKIQVVDRVKQGVQTEGDKINKQGEPLAQEQYLQFQNREQQIRLQLYNNKADCNSVVIVEKASIKDQDGTSNNNGNAHQYDDSPELMYQSKREAQIQPDNNRVHSQTQQQHYQRPSQKPYQQQQHYIQAELAQNHPQFLQEDIQSQQRQSSSQLLEHKYKDTEKYSHQDKAEYKLQASLLEQLIDSGSLPDFQHQKISIWTAGNDSNGLKLSQKKQEEGLKVMHDNNSSGNGNNNSNGNVNSDKSEQQDFRFTFSHHKYKALLQQQHNKKPLQLSTQYQTQYQPTKAYNNQPSPHAIDYSRPLKQQIVEQHTQPITSANTFNYHYNRNRYKGNHQCRGNQLNYEQEQVEGKYHLDQLMKADYYSSQPYSKYTSHTNYQYATKHNHSNTHHHYQYQPTTIPNHHPNKTTNPDEDSQDLRETPQFHSDYIPKHTFQNRYLDYLPSVDDMSHEAKQAVKSERRAEQAVKSERRAEQAVKSERRAEQSYTQYLNRLLNEKPNAQSSEQIEPGSESNKASSTQYSYFKSELLNHTPVYTSYEEKSPQKDFNYSLRHQDYHHLY